MKSRSVFRRLLVTDVLDADVAIHQGTTRLLLTSIPFFKEVIVMSFRCEHCGFSNNEIQSAGSIRRTFCTLLLESSPLMSYYAAEGTIYTARILAREDLDRQLVKSATCTVVIPEVELTIPPSRGQLTTVEGLIRDIVADLSTDQPLRRIENEAAYNKIESILTTFKEVLADEEDEEYEGSGVVHQHKASQKDAPMQPFTIRLDDPSGNSFIEFIGSMSDPKWNMRTYHRTRQQNIDLSLVAEDEPETTQTSKTEEEEKIGGGAEGENEEIYIFPGSCSSCGHPSNTLVKKVNIPYFKVKHFVGVRHPHSYTYLGLSDHVDKL